MTDPPPPSWRVPFDGLHDHLDGAFVEMRPHLRGWLHLASAPLTLASGIVLIALSPTAATRWGSTIYALSAVLLFTGSAILHRGRWSPKVRGLLRRFDHANIFLLIAGSYTPFTLVLLAGRERTVLLSIVWGTASVGILLRAVWLAAPRWLYVAVYLTLGWAAIFFFPSFVAAASTAVLVLMIVGGVLYTMGGVVYGLKRPNPSLRWFGFHEVFHALTIAAFTVHYVGISMATYTLGS
ncbi:MAG: PAQR family membrane homeostasis protein TrhA [Nocardioides sp.]